MLAPVLTVRAEVHSLIPQAQQIAVCNATESLRLLDTLLGRALTTAVFEGDGEPD